jgi:hypothetical protein
LTSETGSSSRRSPHKADAPISSKLVQAGTENIATWDERGEWERILETLGIDCSNSLKRKNLLLVFDEASLGVQCVLDKALFLTANAAGSAAIIGGVSTRLVGCDVTQPGKRKHVGRGHLNSLERLFKNLHMAGQK